LFGEISLFSPSRQRTLTARCESDCLVLSIAEPVFKQLYFENPHFAFQVSNLIAQRLGADIERLRQRVATLEAEAAAQQNAAVPEPEPARWQEQIKELARAGHAAMTRHNDIARAALATVPSGPNALRISEAMLAVMLAGGVPAQIAAWSLDRLFLYLVTDAYESSLHLQKLSDGRSPREYFDDFIRQLTDYYEKLPADRFPNIRANARILTSGDGVERFEFGLDLLIDGLAKYVEK
jgi:hypothetical protein